MLKAINPSTGRIAREVDAATPEQVDAMLDAAARAAHRWARTSFEERANLLSAVARILRDDSGRYAALMTEEMGKPIKEAPGEVLKAAWCAEHYAAHGADYLAPEVIESDASHSFVQYLPLGPILGILPWNAPFWLAFRFCAPALMAGNPCVLKHDSHVPGCAQAIADAFGQAGAPAGVFQNLPLETERVAAVIEDERIKGVSFTGSDRAGGIVAATAAAQVKHSVLELGGSDPAVLLADADLDLAVPTVTTSRFINAGQSCIAAKRIIVEAKIYDEAVTRFRDAVATLKVGDPTAPDTDIGPLARDDLRQNLHRQVHDTVAAGARCLLGGKVPQGDGWFYPATLLADVTRDMAAAREETFGPVAVVMRADDPDHAIELANDTRWGLGASLWTQRPDVADWALRFEAGQVAINGLVKTDPRLPSGGVKRSGFGRELGRHGIHEFVNAQQVWVGPVRD